MVNGATKNAGKRSHARTKMSDSSSSNSSRKRQKKNTSTLLKPQKREITFATIELHRAKEIQLSENYLVAIGHKGYSMARASHGARVGKWFFEVEVGPKGNDDSHTRLGWSTSRGELNAPVGFDQHSYGIRDIDGSKLHQRRREKYGEQYGPGDVLGFYIDLPPLPQKSNTAASTLTKNTDDNKYNNTTATADNMHLSDNANGSTSNDKMFSPNNEAVSVTIPSLLSETEDAIEENMKPKTDEVILARGAGALTKKKKTFKLKTLNGSEIRFYKNGKSFGTAFTNINEGAYFPAVSLYEKACVTFNPGPTFKFPPKDISVYQPFSEAIEKS